MLELLKTDCKTYKYLMNLILHNKQQKSTKTFTNKKT